MICYNCEFDALILGLNYKFLTDEKNGEGFQVDAYLFFTYVVLVVQF